MTRFLALASFLMLAACSSTPEATNRDRLPRAETPPSDTTRAPLAPGDDYFVDEADYERQRNTAMAELDAAIGTPRATTVAGCRVVPVGEKPCGGPAVYRVHAASGSDELLIIRLAATVSALDAEANEQFEYVSTCEVTPEPTPVLIQGLCVAQ